MKNVYITLIAFLAFAFYADTCIGQGAKGVPSLKNLKEDEFCRAVMKSIQDGLDTKVIVQTGIKLGHKVCIVVKCAIEGGGKIEDVVTGAIEAGAPSDVVSKCAIDAGADPTQVAQYVSLAGMPGFCYLEPQEFEDIDIEVPETEPGGGFISPSTP